MSNKTIARRRAHYEALIGAATTHRARVNHATDWVRAIAADLPAHLRNDGIERIRQLANGLQEMEDRDDGQ